MRNTIKFGVLVQYRGSLMKHHGLAVLHGYCGCDHCGCACVVCPCEHDRYVLILSAQIQGVNEVAEHVRPGSFTWIDLPPNKIPSTLRTFVR